LRDTWPHSARGLKEAGYVEGQNVTIEFRSANGEYEIACVGTASLRGPGRLTARKSRSLPARHPVNAIISMAEKRDVVAKLNIAKSRIRPWT
jgi:hypothetical protein